VLGNYKITSTNNRIPIKAKHISSIKGFSSGGFQNYHISVYISIIRSSIHLKFKTATLSRSKNSISIQHSKPMEEQKIFNIASIASIYILGRNATVVGILTKPHKVPTQSHRHTKYVTSILHKSK